MEKYGESNEGSQSDWVGDGPETGLEEPMWKLGLESDGGGVGGGESQYPERFDEANCIYYLRTGYCGYGARCRYNHPKDRNTVTDGARAGAGDYPERAGQPICQFYMKTGACKFGTSCKYHHPRQGPDSTGPVLLNYYGYPLRSGEKECSYYVKTGQCKFGSTCKFHHPQPAGLPGPIPVPPLQFGSQLGSVPTPLTPTTLYPPMQSAAVPSSQQYGVVMARPPMLPPMVPSPYGSFLLSPNMVPFQGWNPYQVHVAPVSSSTAQPTSRQTSMYGVTQLSPSAPAFMGSFRPSLSSVGHSISNQKDQSLPERQGLIDCEYYVKTGYCRYGSSCRYHHPPDSMIQTTNTIMSPSGLPLRLGAPQCLHYSQYGECKYGSSCKFDHSIGVRSYSPSASSLAEVTAISYSRGSSSGTLAPSSSSSELRDEPASAKSGTSSVKSKNREDRSSN